MMKYEQDFIYQIIPNLTRSIERLTEQLKSVDELIKELKMYNDNVEKYQIFSENLHKKINMPYNEDEG